MWLFTLLGFFSVVAKDSRNLQVRARCRADLEHLLYRFKAKHQIIMTPTADYACRIFVHKQTWAEWVAVLAQDIDYVNFKNEVARTDPKRAHIYLNVWNDCLEIDPVPYRKVR